jgi:CO/xanthine dehydrogenase FAD-binding subunit
VASIDEALSLLAENGEDASVLAGGQSLIPLLTFRLVRPDVLVDINGLDELGRIEEADDGSLRIGALVRQAAAERSEAVARRAPLLRQALRHVAHAQIRNRGTVGGSIAHADPAAELPSAIVSADATVVARSSRGQRRIHADDFFVGHFTTALADDELLVAIEVPASPPRTGTAFEEYARRRGDYAVSGAAIAITLDESGVCERARVTLLAAGEVPLRARAAETALLGLAIDAHAAAGAATQAIEVDASGDDRFGGSGYRRDVAEAICGRAISAAGQRAAGGAS